MIGLRVVAAAAIGTVVVAGVVYWEFDNLVPIVGRGVNYVRFFDAPKGTLTTEHNGAQSVVENKQADPVRAAAAAEVNTADAANGAEAANSAKDWPSYNKTITSERFSALDQITKDNARGAIAKFW